MTQTPLMKPATLLSKLTIRTDRTDGSLFFMAMNAFKEMEPMLGRGLRPRPNFEFLFIDQPQDDRIVFDQKVTDDQVAVLHLDDQFLLEAMKHINPDHSLGGEAGEGERGANAGVVVNRNTVGPQCEQPVATRQAEAVTGDVCGIALDIYRNSRGRFAAITVAKLLTVE